MPKVLSHSPQTTLQGKAGCLVTVMDNLEQLYTNATTCLACHNLFRALHGHEKAI